MANLHYPSEAPRWMKVELKIERWNRHQNFKATGTTYKIGSQLCWPDSNYFSFIRPDWLNADVPKPSAIWIELNSEVFSFSVKVTNQLNSLYRWKQVRYLWHCLWLGYLERLQKNHWGRREQQNIDWHLIGGFRSMVASRYDDLPLKERGIRLMICAKSANGVWWEKSGEKLLWPK
jgi:hypothetical protein